MHHSLLHLGEEVLHGLLHFDAKGWRTLPLLVARPGVLTRRYIEGQRARYVSPLALFLFMVFLMFFAIGLQLRDAYRLSLFGTLWRTFVLLIAASVVLLLFVLFILYVTMA